MTITDARVALKGIFVAFSPSPCTLRPIHWDQHLTCKAVKSISLSDCSSSAYVCFCPTEEGPGVRLRFWQEWPKTRVSKTENQLNLQSYFPLRDAGKSSLLNYGIGFHRSLQFKTAFPAPHKGCPFPFLRSSSMGPWWCSGTCFYLLQCLTQFRITELLTNCTTVSRSP